MAGDSGLPPGFVKAYIEIDGGGGKLDCYFNPTEYSIAKANTWEAIKVNGKPSPDQKFTSGTPRKLELSLLFDQSFPPFKMSVADSTAMLLDAMEAPGGTQAGTPTSAPPFFTFGWGRLKFKGCCTSLTCTYKLFSPEGNPLRADVKLSLTQTGQPPKGQNPTTRAQPGFGVHRVKDGDTLPSISYSAYGDATKWRLIAEANGVDNPMHLRRGSSLSLPSLDLNAMPVTSKEKVAAIDVLVDGSPISAEFRELLHEVKVVDSLTLPDMALVRITDKKGDKIDSQPLQVGKKLEIKMGSQEARATASIFKGQIASVEPDFTPTGCTISIRAYDNSHKMNRERKTRTFQQMSASDMINKIAGDSGLSADCESTSVVHEFFQQSNETDWDFAWRLAMMEDYEVVVTDTTLNFRKANKGTGAATSLRFGETLTTWRPRMSGIQQVDKVEVRGWDPKAKKAINGSASSPQTTSSPGVQRSAVASDLGGGTQSVKDRAVTSDAEANAIAKATLQRMADAYFEAEGTAVGNPALKAGSKVKVEGVGTKFGGEFTISSSTHHYRGASGYNTHFQIGGRSSRTLTELMRTPEKRDWASSGLVVGVVTNNNDPEQRARVRVKFPSLSDDEESAWAPVATMSSGNARGMLMLPQVDEEVVIGFEHGDTRRPIVLGSTFNGKDKPGEELLQNRDGSLGVVSNEKIHQHSKKDFEIKSDQNFTIEVTKDETHDVKGNFKAKAQTIELEAGSSVKVKGVSINVEASGALTLKGATVNIEGSGPVSIKGAILNLG